MAVSEPPTAIAKSKIENRNRPFISATYRPNIPRRVRCRRESTRQLSQKEQDRTGPVEVKSHLVYRCARAGEHNDLFWGREISRRNARAVPGVRRRILECHVRSPRHWAAAWRVS